jgi:uncharacterized protein YkwD
MMHNTWRHFVWALLAAMTVTLAGCTGGVLPGASAEPRVQDFLSLLRPNNDAEEIVEPATPVADSAQVPASQQDCIEPGEPSTPVHEQLFADLNQYREEHGLSTLVYSKRLEAVADAYLQDMYERGYFAHINPEGLNPGERAVAGGFCHYYVGENLAAGQRSVKAAMRAWDQSPSHQLNMLEPNYVYVGVGHFVDPITGRQYWAQEFAYQLE